jgi:5-methylthioadenosine/S-adenosylhomocysteine deaminase
MDHDDRILEQGALLIRGHTIADIGPAGDLAARYPGAERVDEPHGLIMPGLVNVHTHAAMSCFRGLADDLPLMQWLQEYIFPREARLTGEMVYVATLLSICEMIRSGTTSFVDMYLFAGDVARAAAQSGMRAWLGEALYDFPSPCYGELDNGFACMEELFDRYRQHELVNISMTPHAVYTCSPPLLERVRDMAAAHNALVQIHLSETEDEISTCLEQYGARPVEHLDRLGLLNERLVAAHCVHLDEDEIELLARRGVKVAHCPESNMKLASGTAPVVRMLAAGLCLGIGTDGSASNNDVDMFGEMATAAKLHKVARMDPTAMDARAVVRSGTVGGAGCLGMEKEIGSLAVGAKADLIVLDFDQPHLTPVYNPVSHLVYAVRGSDVLHSMVDGRWLMRERKILTLDEEAILAEVRDLARQIEAM